MLLEFPVELGVEEHDEVSEHAGELDSFCSLLRPLDPEISEIGPRWRRCPPRITGRCFFLRKSKLQQQTRVLEQVMVEHLGLGRGPEHLSR